MLKISSVVSYCRLSIGYQRIHTGEKMWECLTGQPQDPVCTLICRWLGQVTYFHQVTVSLFGKWGILDLEGLQVHMHSEKLQTYNYNKWWDILDLLPCYICYLDAPIPKSGFLGCCELKFSTSTKSYYPSMSLPLLPALFPPLNAYRLVANRWWNNCTNLNAIAWCFEFSVNSH